MGIHETRGKIVIVADRLFSRFGFQKTSMDEIAKIARKAKGSLYYHFSSKEDLFREVVLNEVAEIKSELAALLGNRELSAEGKLKKYVLTRFDLMQHATNYNEIMNPWEIDHLDFLEDIRLDFYTWEKERLTIIVNDGMERGEFHIDMAPEVLSEMFIMIMKGLEIPFYTQGKYEQYFPQLEGMIKILLKGMR